MWRTALRWALYVLAAISWWVAAEAVYDRVFEAYNWSWWLRLPAIVGMAATAYWTMGELYDKLFPEECNCGQAPEE